MDVIFLIGARGSGKSTLGPLLAEELGGAFRDLDAELCDKGEQTPAEDAGALFARLGERAFRELESQALSALLDECARSPQTTVIATGGGVVEMGENHALLRRGRCVWLQAQARELARRVTADPTPRPPLPGTGSTPLDEARSILERRAPLYASLATHSCDTTGAVPEDLARGLARWAREAAANSGAGEGKLAPALLLAGLLCSWPLSTTPALASSLSPARVSPAPPSPGRTSQAEASGQAANSRGLFISSYRELAATAPEGLATVHARLRDAEDGLGEAAANAQVDRALVLVAGRDTPPGLSAARGTERDRLRAAGLAVVAAGLSNADGERARWLSCLHGCLEAASEEPELWLAAAHAVGDLEVEDLAGFVARGLVHGGATPLGLGARRALHGLYHRWFSGPDDYAAFRATLDRPVGGTLYRGPLMAAEARAFERLERILDLRPAEATAWVADPNPAVRAAALAALARGVGRGEVPAQTALAVLTTRIAVEVDPGAFHGAVDTLQKLLTGTPADAAAIVTLRGQLDAVLRSGDEARFGAVAVALSRLPWNTATAGVDPANTDPRNTDPANTDASNTDAPSADPVSSDPLDPGASFAWGLARITWLVNRQGRPGRPWDGDALAQSLGALDALCQRSLTEGGVIPLTHMAESVRQRVFDLLADQRAPTSVRLAAAGAAAHLALPGEPSSAGEGDASGVRRLSAVLADSATGTPVRYALLGTLARLAPSFAPPAAGSGELADDNAREPTGHQLILDAFVTHLARSEVELRARTLELLAARELDTYARAAGAELYLARLAVEPSREMRAHLLDLLARFRRPDLVGKLLASPAAAALAGEDARGVRRLAATLATLAGNDPGALTASAHRLVAFPGPRTRLPRLEEALALVAVLTPDQALRLDPLDHGHFIDWALELRAARGSQPLRQALLGSLVEVHLALALEHGEPTHLAHGAALLLGDCVLGEAQASAAAPGRGTDLDAVPVAHDPQEALTWYGRALEAHGGRAGVPDNSTAALARATILRDRARYFSGLGDDAGARDDYRDILLSAHLAASGAAPAHPGGASPVAVLDLSDLRRAAALLASAPLPASAGSAASTTPEPQPSATSPHDPGASATEQAGGSAAAPGGDAAAAPGERGTAPDTQPAVSAPTDHPAPARLGAATDQSLAVFAFLIVVERPAWVEEPLAVRLKDLALMADYALLAGGQQLTAVRALFAAALAAASDQATVSAGPVHAWRALLADSASTATLGNIAARLQRPRPAPGPLPANGN
ncbi:MAG TPA: shikimate kinase [Planctomycetota bacterium]|nr:shikimate kinase [Planctomycetota bacterium]